MTVKRFKNWLKEQQGLQELKFQETTIEKNENGFTKTIIQSFEGDRDEIEMIVNSGIGGNTNGL
jgi:hypothetical protein